MDQGIRNKLRNVVTQCRKLLEEAVSQVLQGQFGIYASGKKDEVHVEDESRMKNLTEEDKGYRRDIQAHLGHIEALGYKAKDALAQLVREIAFTHLNRLCAYKMMEAREVWVGGQRFRESVSRGMKSQGFQFYLADHADAKTLFDTGHQDVAYRHFLGWLGALLSEEIGVLFSPTDPANRLFPPQRVLDDVLALLNSDDLKDIWAEDETIGWVYQYFTPKELRDQVRKESAAPRNSYELAFRNQFFTPRYVVEFLTDNTLGRIWYEMRKGDTKLKDQCRYMVRRPNEVFLADPLLSARRVHISVESADKIPPTVQAAFRGDFANAVTEKDGIHQAWIGLAIPPDQYKAATGHPFRENDDHPAVTEVWNAIHEPDGKSALHPLKVLVALSQLTLTASGGPYADRAAKQLWTAFNEAVKAQAEQADLTQEELLKQPVCIPHRPKKDPRELRILDPACGSGHFLLYCFDLLLTIYEEAYADPDLRPKLKEDYPTLDALRRDVPRLILAHNLHGIDIDLRASQIAALALWLRCQRMYREMGLKQDRPKITKSNIVCAEPMPGEESLFQEFLDGLDAEGVRTLLPNVVVGWDDDQITISPPLIDDLKEWVKCVWENMKFASNAGSLLQMLGVEPRLQRQVQEAFRDIFYSLFREQVAAILGTSEEEAVRSGVHLVLELLRVYVTGIASDGDLLHVLFREDTVRGVAFLDVCRQEYDVVLMNPPFGESSRLAKPYIDKFYPKTKNDLYAAFVERGLSMLVPRGFLGAITSRSGFFLTSFQKWREEILLAMATPTVIADLGYGVLDTAMVETAAYCLAKNQKGEATRFFNLFRAKDKEAALKSSVSAGNEGKVATGVFDVDSASFRQVPGSPFAYWVSERVRRLFNERPPLESGARRARLGINTTDDTRFLRLWWEVDNILQRGRWTPIFKGGGYAPYYLGTSLVIDWEDNGRHLKDYIQSRGDSPSRNVRSESLYFQCGLTYSSRTQKGLAFQPLPAGSLFTVKGPGVFLDDRKHLLAFLGLVNSSAFRILVGLQMAFGSYEVGVIQRTPIVENADPAMAKLALEAVNRKRNPEQVNEISHLFVSPLLPVVVRPLDELQSGIDDLAFKMYGIGPEDLPGIEKANYSVQNENDAGDDDEEPRFDEGTGQRQKRLLSYAVGCLMGRWDIRYATGEKSAPELPDPFDPLPSCSPGMLQESDTQLLAAAPAGYPFRFDPLGIVPDDPDHTDDIVRRVREVLELIWKERAEAIEKEACEILGVGELREYFRKPGKGGFWDDHVSRYSKSRRKAPIYWLLQSSKKNYSLWLYYHRLDKDILFKARQKYVEPKIRLEQTRLDSLRSQKTAALTPGPSPKGRGGNNAKKIDKDIERQEDLLGELKDFAEKLERAAKLNFGNPEKLNSEVVYDPDLNDGVVLTIAPLWELVPWKEAKNYWEELLEGKYEWSSMGKLLRKKGLVK